MDGSMQAEIFEEANRALDKIIRKQRVKIKQLQELLREVATQVWVGYCNSCRRRFGNGNHGIHCASCGRCLETWSDLCTAPDCKLAAALDTKKEQNPKVDS